MTTKSIARERLLDLGLEEVLANCRVAAPHRSRLLVAAVLLCGIGVVATLMWQPRTTPSPVQEPHRAPLPPAARANSAAELAALPANATNIDARFASPAELAGLLRFRDLRRLCVLPSVASPPVGSSEEVYRRLHDERAAASARFAAAGAGAFEDLGGLLTLESLELPPGIQWTPAHFAFLRSLKVRELALWVVDLRTRDMRDALLAPPALQSLRLRACAVDERLFDALAGRPIEALELRMCAGLDDGAWTRLRDLRTLRRLELTHMDGVAAEFAAALGTPPLQLGAVGDAAFDAIAALPLEHLRIHEAPFPDDLLTRLPTTLRSLDLGSTPTDAGAARSLRRLTNLRALTFGHDLDERDAAAVLPSWSLERLDYLGMVFGVQPDQTLLQAIAAQPQLNHLSLRINSRTNLAALANAPRLRTLALQNLSDQGIALAQLAPLAACKELSVLRLGDSKLEERAVHTLLGDHVTIELTTTP